MPTCTRPSRPTRVRLLRPACPEYKALGRQCWEERVPDRAAKVSWVAFGGAHIVRRGIAAEDLDEVAGLHKLSDGGRGGGFFGVAIQIDEEDVLPGPLARRPGFDFRKIDAML